MNLDRVATLLTSGIKPAQVASIVGVSPGRISQLLKDSTELQNLIAEKEAELKEKDIEDISLTAKYHSVEHALLNQIQDLAATAELRDVTAALRVVAERQEKMRTRVNPVTQGSLTINHAVIQIALPKHALPQVALNEQNEVIAIDNQTLAPLSSEGVTNLFQTLKETQSEQARLPSPSSEGTIQALSKEAMNFLDSLHPAPYAGAF